MKCAKEQGIRIILEGHGGDELLCGYPLYYFYYFMTLLAHRKWQKLLVEVLQSRDQTWDEAKILFRTYSPNVGRHIRSLIRRVLKNENLSTRQTSVSSRFDTPSLTIDLASKLESDMALESIPTALACVDKSSMWHGVEIRTPFLTERFVEHCASLPLDQKMRDGWTKYAFRLAMKTTLPEQIRLRRKKIGFQMPHLSWIEGELRQTLRNFFSDPNLKGTRYYNSQTARHILNKATMTMRDANIIWRMVNVELWLREFFSNEARETEK
jgi:asparagine synthase (glutamine-hydrolysing)